MAAVRRWWAASPDSVKVPTLSTIQRSIAPVDPAHTVAVKMSTKGPRKAWCCCMKRSTEFACSTVDKGSGRGTVESCSQIQSRQDLITLHMTRANLFLLVRKTCVTQP